jgi:sugar phosphate permease
MLRYQGTLQTGRRFSLTLIKEGIAFVRDREVLLGAMSLDMFAVIFGGAQALLPVYSRDILHHGSSGYGLLLASLQVGAFVMSFGLVARKPIERTGQAMILTIIAFGLLTMAFGFSRIFVLSMLLYGLIGAADQISVIMRQTTIQMATPDELRGRVTAVNQVFVQASNQIGAIESGFVAALFGATFSVVSGGLISVLVATAIGLRMPLLYNYRVPRTASAPEAETQMAEIEEAVVEEEAIAGGAS